jgi:hypothetical protein
MGDGSTQFYFCGLKRMYASVTEVLERMGKVGRQFGLTRL